LAQVVWTLEAQLWLRDIFDYIAAENPEAATRVVSELYDAAESLREHPRLGQRYRHVTDREVRVLIHDTYRIGYLIRKDTRDIEILGVFHGALPIERYLL
jgi:toxin ParE1/3/4